MKANELRIGNLLLCRGAVSEVLEVYECHIKTKKEDKIPMRIVQGIPLTEEWLLRFGFECRSTTKQMGLVLFTKRGKALVYRESYISFFGVTIETPIIHVHQLQNLYFALTSEELTLKQ
jgi:hypothetical protein